MEITLELFVSDRTGEKMVFLATDGASGAEYPYKTAKDVGDAVAFYLSNYYPKVIENPEYNPSLEEE